MDEIFRAVMDWLYADARRDEKAVFQAGELPNIQLLEANHGLQQLANRDLLRFDVANGRVCKTLLGRRSYLHHSYLHMMLGSQFTFAKYRSAVVHIIVRNQNGDECGGSGCFVSDLNLRILTSAHVVAPPLTIERIEDWEGKVIQHAPFAVQIANRKLVDLAIIDAVAPPGIECPRIEWDTDTDPTLSHGVLLGYPLIANHQPRIACAEYKIVSKTAKIRYPDVFSLIFSSETQPGFSGGPLINEVGRVLGVIEQGNHAHREGVQAVFYGAALAADASEFLDGHP